MPNDLFSDFQPPANGPYGESARGPIPVRDPHVPRVADRRLTRQAQDILELLQRGRQPNSVLAGVTSRFGARLFDLKHWFKDTGQPLEIRIVKADHRTGLFVYALFRDGQEVGAKLPFEGNGDDAGEG